MARVITLVARSNVVDQLNALAQEENSGDLFSAGLATEANPTVEVARWARWDADAYEKQPQRTKDPDEGGWQLHKTLAAHPQIGSQIAEQNGWGVDDRMEFRHPTTNQVVLLAYRNKGNAYIQSDIEASFGVKLVPLEVPEV